MKGCLSQRDMVAFVEGAGSAEDVAGCKRHLRVCDRCARAVARVRAGMAPDEEATGPTAAVVDNGVDRRAVGLEPNLQIGDFRLERRLGSGGMGVVYQAMQLSLNRRVALKVLPFGLAADCAVLERFHREARAAARLRHRNIVTIYAEGVENNVCYFAMEMIDGRNLDQVIAELRTAKYAKLIADRSLPTADLQSEPGKPLADGGDAEFHSVLSDCASPVVYFGTVARLIAEVAEALDYAHRAGIIHRDVKPSNLMLARDGRLVLLDFGIARICEERAMTLTGSFIGTPRYMSPEQIAGGHDEVDHRSDIYSLGATLYELLTLEPLFSGQTQQEVIGRILNSEPRRPRQVDRRIPADLATICSKAIEKHADRRYQSAAEFAEDLRRYLAGRVIVAKAPGPTDRLIKLIRRRTVTVVLAAAVFVATAFAATIAWTHYTTQWAQQYAMAQIDQLIEQGEYFRAHSLASRAERYIRDDPLLVSRWPRLSRPYTIMTSPFGAKVYIGGYPDRKPNWKYLGRSPVERARIPFGTYRLRVEKAGYIPLEVVRSNEPPSPSSDPASIAADDMGFTLHRKGKFPSDMVWISSSDLDQGDLFHGSRHIASAPAFLIDKYETTNRQYKEFVEHGGYEDPEFWQEPFVKDGRRLTWVVALDFFRDSTGRPGPAAWQNGAYPPGEAAYPVGGLSWYEAVAYARFRGKELPSIFHWLLATSEDRFPYRIARYGNFEGGPAPVGHYPGMGRFGVYDAAGNVREWCCNAIEGEGETRAILGGGWSDHEYLFVTGEVRCSWDRDIANGVRCVVYLGGRQAVPELALCAVQRKHRDFERFHPVSNEVLDSYIDTWYRYDPTELRARIEATDYDRNLCRRQRITFDAAYPNERVIAYLHLPNGVAPPYQVVVWYPGGEARDTDWDERAHKQEMTEIVKSGRALIVPFYKGTYERRLARPLYPPEGIQSRNLYIQRSQDLRRTIDYLQTRDDIDTNKLAYVGLSWGAQMGPLMVAVEGRFKTAILLLGGICACERHPASDPANFAPGVTIPVLMINAKEDSVFPYETAQRPLFNLLGTHEPYKKHILLPGGHGIPWEYHKQYYSEIVKWLDQYLGPVDRMKP